KDMQVTVIDTKMAGQLRAVAAASDNVGSEDFAAVLTGEYVSSEKKSKDKGEKIMLPTAMYKRYLSSYSKKEVNEIIEKALSLYFENIS
ncbi:MAG: hypothetical protein ACI4I1_10395, partial [Oscillospiraceae bacterium]